MAQANPAGSSTGIASLNGYTGGAFAPTYIGAVDFVPLRRSVDDRAGWRHVVVIGSPAPQVDFARFVADPGKTSGGDCSLADSNVSPPRTSGNELVCDTFWGYAEDMCSS